MFDGELTDVEIFYRLEQMHDRLLKGTDRFFDLLTDQHQAVLVQAMNAIADTDTDYPQLPAVQLKMVRRAFGRYQQLKERIESAPKPAGKGRRPAPKPGAASYA